MPNEEQINSIGIKLALSTQNFSSNLLRSVFKVKDYERKIGYEQMDYALKRYFSGATLLDSNYFLIPIWLWRKIIEADWTNKMTYIKERYDCDNFAFSFASRMGELYGLNSAPPVYGKWYSEQGVFIDYHYWNCIVDNDLNCWLYEPMNDLLVPYKGEKKISIGGKGLYEPLKVSLVF